MPLDPSHAESVEDALARRDIVTALHLHDDDVSSISLDPRVAELKALRSVHIGSNRADIEAIDGLAALTQVASLRSLSLSVEGVVALPSAIFALSQLTELHLRGRWAVLPPELAQLTNLARLDLQLSRLSELPDELGALRKLSFLSLRGCRVKRLPESCSDLESLVDLFAENNRLVTLPESIGRLPALRRLLLQGNRLEHIPASVALIPGLETLSLRNNASLDTIPVEVATREGLRLEIEPSKLPAEARDLALRLSSEAFATLDSAAREHERAAWTLVVEEGEGAANGSTIGGPAWLAPDERAARCGVCGDPMAPFLQVNLALTGELDGLLQLWGCPGTPDVERLRAIAEQDVDAVHETYREHLREFFAAVPASAQPGIVDRARSWTTTAGDSGMLKHTKTSGNSLEYTLRFSCRVLASYHPVGAPFLFARVVDVPARASSPHPEAVPHDEGPPVHRVVDVVRHVSRPHLQDLAQGNQDVWTAYESLTDERRREVDTWPVVDEKLGGWPAWLNDASWGECPECGERMTRHVASIGGDSNGLFGGQLEGTVVHVLACNAHPRSLRWCTEGG